MRLGVIASQLLDILTFADGDLVVTPPPSFAGADTVVYDWRKNGASIAALNMGIAESGATTANSFKDYSTNAAALTDEGAVGFNADGVVTNSGSSVHTLNNDGFVTTDVDIRGLSQFTIATWIKLSEYLNYRFLFTQRGGGLNRALISTGDTIGTSWGFQNQLVFTISDGTNHRYVMDQTLALDTWYHVVAIFDGTQVANADRLKIYLNGTRTTGTTEAGVPATVPNYTSNSFKVLNNKSGTGSWRGQSDNYMVFTGKVLTPEQITAFYNGGTPSYNRLVAEELSSGTWTCQLTPVTGGVAGTPVLSNAITI